MRYSKMILRGTDSIRFNNLLWMEFEIMYGNIFNKDPIK